jgi:branched-chain amino acid transport system ATP-binding protein
MTTLLAVESVRKRFRGVYAVQEFSARLGVGEAVGLIGPNGAGKTTVFNIVSGFIAQDGGDVMWQGVSLAHSSPSARANRGLVRTFQHTRVFPTLTVLDNVMSGTHRLGRHRDAREHCEQLLDRLGLTALRDTPAKELPYGHAKVLSLGIALAANPSLLLLDEPAAGLNTHETDNLREILERVRRPDLTMWVIEHNMAFVMSLCQRILVLSAGRLIAEGTPDEVRLNRAVQEAYLGAAEHGAAGA